MSLNRGGFQTFVNRHMAPGVVGAFASMNPRSVVLAGPGALIADSDSPVVVGFFAWAADGVAYGSEQSNAQLGFVGNEGQTVITDFLGVSRLSIQAGFPVTLYNRGDFWAQVAGGDVAVGDHIYADVSTGEPTVVTTSFDGVGTIDNGSGSAGTILTISAVNSGLVRVGDTLIGTTTAGTKVLSQTSGTPGGVGAYVVNTSQDFNPGGAITVAGVDTGFVAQTAAPADATSSSSSIDASGVLTVGGSITGTIEIGDGNDVVVNGSGVPANIFILSAISGTGGAGTYQTSYIGSAITARAMTFSTGKLVKISRPF